MSKKESNPSPPEKVTWGTAITRYKAIADKYKNIVNSNNDLKLRTVELFNDLIKANEALLCAYDMQGNLIDVIETAHIQTSDGETKAILLEGLKNVQT